MLLTILGSSAAYAGKNQGCSSYLLSSDGGHYLIDTGPGCVSSLQNHVSFGELSGIILSHLHADHTTDIYTLRYAVYVAREKGELHEDLPAYLPKSPGKTFRTIRKTLRNEFTVTPVTRDLRLQLGSLEVRFLKTVHAVPAYAMRFEESESRSSLVYTADTAYFEELVRFSEGADILLAEATFQNSEAELQKLGHMTAERAGMLARNAGVKTLLLTHIMPYYDTALSLSEARVSFSGTIVVAEKGGRFPLGQKT
jgi:ribonuclease BN (tRNA processing enzyme)